MAGTYERYIIRNPIWEDLPNEGVKGTGEETRGTIGSQIYMADWRIRTSPLHMAYNFILEIPTPNPYVVAHDHPYDELLFFMGSNGHDFEDLGATVEVSLEDEVYEITTTTAIYVPAGMKHCPITYTRVDRPHGFIALSLNGSYESGDYTRPKLT